MQVPRHPWLKRLRGHTLKVYLSFLVMLMLSANGAFAATVLQLRTRSSFDQTLESLTFRSAQDRSAFMANLAPFRKDLANTIEEFMAPSSMGLTFTLAFDEQGDARVRFGAQSLRSIILATATTSRLVPLESLFLLSKVTPTDDSFLNQYTGICGLLSAADSMLNKLGCSWTGHKDPDAEGEKNFEPGKGGWSSHKRRG
jgi:hypothetical protein